MTDSRAEMFQRHQDLSLAPVTFERMAEMEKIAWRLHEGSDPAGTIMLGDMLLTRGHSYVKGDLKVRAFAHEILPAAHLELVAKPPTDQWDWYWLGISHEMGRGTRVDHEQAAKAFQESRLQGNVLAGFEEIWSAYLAGASATESAARFAAYEGPAKQPALRSAKALNAMAAPPPEVGSESHLARIRELASLRHGDYWHISGHRLINVVAEAEFRKDLEALKALDTPVSALILHVIARSAAHNPTGESPEAWLRKSLSWDNTALLSWFREGNLSAEEICDLGVEGWGKAELEAWIHGVELSATAGAIEDPDAILGSLPSSTTGWMCTHPIQIGAFGYISKIDLDGRPDQDVKQRAAWLSKSTVPFRDAVAAAMAKEYTEQIRPEYLDALKDPNRSYFHTAADLPELESPDDIWKLISGLRSLSVGSYWQYRFTFNTTFDLEHQIVVSYDEVRFPAVTLE